MDMDPVQAHIESELLPRIPSLVAQHIGRCIDGPPPGPASRLPKRAAIFASLSQSMMRAADL